MNLGKLLGAGKSFLGGRGTVSYREDKRVYLPKFNTEKNPFAPKPAEPASAAVSAKIKPAVVPSAAPTMTGAKKIFPSAIRPVRVISWKDKLNPFRSSKPVAPPMVGTVQVELSLDAVKVVHNDLADADIEIVPVRSQTVATPAAPILPPARQPWGFLDERLIKAG